MKRSYRFVEPSGVAVCTLDGQSFEIPVFAGILKHPTVGQLQALLEDPVVVRRYVREALRKAPWPALRLFPRAVLRSCLADGQLREGRRAALNFLLTA